MAGVSILFIGMEEGGGRGVVMQSILVYCLELEFWIIFVFVKDAMQAGRSPSLFIRESVSGI